MSEPRFEDDEASGRNSTCEQCAELVHDCDCGQLDTLTDEE